MNGGDRAGFWVVAYLLIVGIAFYFTLIMLAISFAKSIQ